MMRLGAEDERPTLHGEDELTSCSDLAVTAARYTAAELTASAYGPLNEWAFVAPSSASAGCLDGLGLFARVSLRAGQAIAEYSGARLPMRMLARRSLGTLIVAGSHTFIDGYRQNSPFGISPLDGPLAAAVYAAAAPAEEANARLETWPMLRASMLDSVRQRLWLVDNQPEREVGVVVYD